MPDMPESLTVLTREKLGAASAMLAEAFFNDPKLTRVIPDPAVRRDGGRHVFEFDLRFGMKYGRVYATSPDLEEVAVWLPSDKYEITRWRAIGCGGMGLWGNLGKEALDRIGKFGELVDRIHRQQAPFPHWYLFIIGVRPGLRVSGFGSRLMRPMLDWLDGRRLPCYLMTHNEKKIALYEHFGFRIVRQQPVPGSGILHRDAPGSLRITVSSHGPGPAVPGEPAGIHAWRSLPAIPALLGGSRVITRACISAFRTGRHHEGVLFPRSR